VSGTCLRGTIRLNDVLLLGPDPLGQFQPITVKTIHRKRMPVKELRAGQTASFALKKVCIEIVPLSCPLHYNHVKCPGCKILWRNRACQIYF